MTLANLAANNEYFYKEGDLKPENNFYLYWGLTDGGYRCGYVLFGFKDFIIQKAEELNVQPINLIQKLFKNDIQNFDAIPGDFIKKYFDSINLDEILERDTSVNEITLSELRDEDLSAWEFGFDFNHLSDLLDLEALEKHFPEAYRIREERNKSHNEAVKKTFGNANFCKIYTAKDCEEICTEMYKVIKNILNTEIAKIQDEL